MNRGQPRRDAQSWSSCCTPISLNFISFLVFFFIIHLIASFSFYQGFLLMRYEVPNKSECNVPPVNNPDAAYSGCWFPAPFKKAVIIVVDALRFDFVPIYNESEVEPGMLATLTTPTYARLQGHHSFIAINCLSSMSYSTRALSIVTCSGSWQILQQ